MTITICIKNVKCFLHFLSTRNRKHLSLSPSGRKHRKRTVQTSDNLGITKQNFTYMTTHAPSNPAKTNIADSTRHSCKSIIAQDNACSV